ncbi:MAG: hypothetical protein LBP64_08555 [Tannerella sp.]|nr:hypothetical protein [Tannerella sp.]
MRNTFFAFVVVAAFAGLRAFAGDDTAPATRIILFAGLKGCYFSSDYYTADRIAENFGVATDATDEFINREFYNAFADAAVKQSLRLSACDDAAARLVAGLRYDYDGDVLYSNLSEIDEEEYRRVMQDAQAAYLLVIDQYYIKKEVYPYDSFTHMFHYSVYDASKARVYDGHYRFVAFDLGTLPLLQKQIRKAADKCLRSIGASDGQKRAYF